MPQHTDSHDLGNDGYLDVVWTPDCGAEVVLELGATLVIGVGDTRREAIEDARQLLTKIWTILETAKEEA